MSVPSTRLRRGPRKPGSSDRRDHEQRPRRHSTHKARSQWFQMRAAWPLREAPVHLLLRERARAALALAPFPGNERWELAGPTNVGGRMTCVVCDPGDPDCIWAGAAGGGIWRSTDAGRTWQPLWHSQPTLNIGSLTISPHDARVLYCGTGEANLSADSYAGAGIFRSNDGGSTWALIATPELAGIPSRIGAIAVDPFDPLHLRVGGVGFVGDTFGGMYVSRDGGATWAREIFISTRNHWCHAIEFHPSEQGTLFATFTERGVRSGIWRSRDGGQTWQQLLQGLPAPESFGRTSLALAPSNPAIIYAIAAEEGEGVLGVFRSVDGGDTWREIGGSEFQNERQMSYNNTIAVHPTDPNHVICGGVDLHLTRDGGQTWQQVTFWDRERGDTGYAHADHHALLMPPADPGRIYDMNDGGMDVSADGGLTWSNCSDGLAVTMYYDLDAAQNDGRVFGGGTQDNGTQVTTTGGSDDHFEILGGDGGWIVFDPAIPGHLYASYYNMNIFRWRNGTVKRATPPAPAAERERVWMVFIAMDPANTDIVFTGSTRIWRTQDDGASWQAVSPSLDGSTITAIEIAPADSRRVYVGTENGGFFRSTDGGNTWSRNLAGATLPGRTITRIEASPNDEDLVFATIANFGNSHVFRSRDGGLIWQDADNGQLPDVPHHSIAIPPDDPDTVYVCGDAGVHVSPDQGQTWFDFTRNLPRASVVDLVYHANDRTLTAATYGRSLWRIAMPPP